uniref:Gelsolin-like domain-containing protein n=1 Tax=Pectinophora gossypiella TaxID=13191 RepID=A0A1E1WJ25_PECGO
MQNPKETLKNCGKKPGLEVFVVKIIKPPKKSGLFSSPPPSEVIEYKVFPVAPRYHGIFYSEDLYAVVKTHTDSKKDIHFWFGQVYKETPPSWVDNIDELELNWAVNQHFEFQGHECKLFESYFQNSQPIIRYKRGRHPEPNTDKERGATRFYKLLKLDSGSYRVLEIPFNIALMTKEECFILDTDYNTRAYVSDRTPIHERDKSVLVANHMRELEHEGNGEVEVVDLTTFKNESDKEAYIIATNIHDIKDDPTPVIDYDQPDDNPEEAQLSMLSSLYSEDSEYSYPPRFRYIPRRKKSVVEDKNKEKDKQASAFTRLRKSVVSRIRRLFGYEKKKELEVEPPTLEEKFAISPVVKPFKKEELNSKKCYMIQGATGKGIILWIGKASEPIVKEEVTQCVCNEIRKDEPLNEEYINRDFTLEVATEAYEKKIDDKTKDGNDNTARWTHIYKISEGNEPLKFKRYFQDWN